MNNFENLRVKSSYQIDKWFPDTIYVTKDVCNYLLPSLEKSAKRIAEEKGTIKSPSLWVNSTHRTASFEIKKIHPFDILADYIKYHANNYLQELGYHNKKLHIINMWFNISDEGDFNFPHSHPGSFISGVFYIKSPPNTLIQFYDTNRMIGNIWPADDTNNYLSYDLVRYECATGSLMLWMSNFVHGNPRQMVEGEKIAVSFNIDMHKDYDD